MRYARNLARIACHMPPERTVVHALVRDDDAIVTSVATDNVATHDYTGATLDGALANPGPAVLWLPRTVSVTTQGSPATYNIVDPIVVTGTDEFGIAQVGYLIMTNAGGGERVRATNAAGTRVLLWTSVTNIHTPIQLGAGGFFEFGVEDIACGTRVTFRSFVADANGNIGFQYEDGTADSVPVLAGAEPLELSGVSLVLGATTTAVPLHVFVDDCTPCT